MALSGEAYKKTFKIIKGNVRSQDTLEYVEEKESKCCFLLPALASLSSSDDILNDKTGFYFGYTEIVSSVVLELYKDDISLGDISTLGYGTDYPYGFHEDGGKKYVGHLLNWKDVLIGEGEGKYYVKSTATLITSGTYEEDSFTYCLKEYNNSRSNGTIRFDFYHNGIIGNKDQDIDLISYKDLNWFNSIRLYGIVNKETTSYESEQIQYTNGQRIDVSSQQEPEYEVQINPMPYVFHKFLKTEVLQADDIYVTDYNANCPLKPFILQNLKHTGNYEPNWQPKNKNAGVYIKMLKKFNNLRKRFC